MDSSKETAAVKPDGAGRSTEFRLARAPRTRPLARALCAALALALAGASAAADPAVDAALQLLADGDAAGAKAAFERVLEQEPQSIEARLGLARAYQALGEYARAKIEFETVLDFDNLPPDLLGQDAVYAEVADDYAQGRRTQGFGYAETGLGYYRGNSTSASDEFGGDEARDPFWLARVGGGLNRTLDSGSSLSGTLDYRFRHYDESTRRNDSDLRWNGAYNRPLDENRWRLGVRGRVSYRGNSDYRNDYGVFSDYRVRLDPDNQLTFGAELRTRRYPTGPLRSRSRDIGELTGNWSRAFAEGRGNFSLGVNLARQWATQERPDGDATVYGAEAELGWAFNERLDGFLFAWWNHEGFSDEVHDASPDYDGNATFARSDNLYEAVGGLSWSFAPGWTLRPEVVWIRDQSNVGFGNYSSIEGWVSVRLSF